MRLLRDILYKAGAVEIQGSTNLAILSVTADSRKVEKNGLFVAVRGLHSNGHAFIGTAEDNGAIAVVCEELPEIRRDKVSYIVVKDSALALGRIASNFFDNPSSRIKVVGITGTNGKTTIASLLFQLFQALGHPCGLLSTVKNQIGAEVLPSTHTTPDPVQLQSLLDKMVKAGCTYAFMEVSSHAVDQHRIHGVDFTGGVFTNLTHDHLDYHKTFENYLAAKQRFFTELSSDAFALVNRDDDHGLQMAEFSKASLSSYGLSQGADFTCRILEKELGGMMLRLDDQDVWTPLIGVFNAYNLLAVYGVAVLLGQDKVNTLTALSTLSSVEGRFQYVQSDNKITAIVDYAHTPDALENVLRTVAELRTGNEQVITLVGCGGDRDAAKRPEMARIACELSDKVILTSDNPRSEEPDEIIRQMKVGVDAVNAKKVLAITDRREAIRTACALSKPGDIILVAGKGHEKFQEIKGVKHPFDDMQEVKETFNLQGS
jgi:UDP-N-acetylmuramoyl-L-alanyl-D-glutamate--2,6-diaminopimelate ligase